MRVFVVAAFLALASARPDIGLELQNRGYHGPNSYEVGHNGGYHYSSGSSGSGHSAGAAQSSSGSFSSGAAQSSGGSFSSGAAQSSGGSFSSGAASGGNRFGGASFGSGGGASAGGSTQVITGHSGFLDFSSGGGASSGGKIIKPVIKHGPAIVSKSYYLHAAPDEEPAHGAEVEEREHIVRPRKHYNIVFVKAPIAGGGSSISSNNVNVFPENEEKTIVYVLTGRNDGVTVNENGEIQVPQPRPPSKPEVVFVKYNNEADAQRAISDIQSSYNTQSGASVSILGAGSSAGSSSFSQSGGGGFRSDVGSDSSAAIGLSSSAGASVAQSVQQVAHVAQPIQQVAHVAQPIQQVAHVAQTVQQVTNVESNANAASFTSSSSGGESFRFDGGASGGASESFSSSSAGTSSNADSVSIVASEDIGVDLTALGDHGYTVHRSGRTFNNNNNNINHSQDKVLVEAVKSKEIPIVQTIL